VEAFARADPQLAVTAEIWDRDPWLLGTPGGTVDLRTGELRTARREDFITKQTGAAPEPGEPRRWLQFLREATAGDSELVRFLQQVAGYCLTGSTREHSLFFIYGPGGNGKSVFLNLLNYVLGDYATTAAMETFTASKHDRHPTDLAMLNGARLVSASETEEGRAWAESRIKQLTGGDKIRRLARASCGRTSSSLSRNSSWLSWAITRPCWRTWTRLRGGGSISSRSRKSLLRPIATSRANFEPKLGKSFRGQSKAVSTGRPTGLSGRKW
jgi:hypothetical protein